MTKPTHALTVLQPWAWAIAEGVKTIENRLWRTNYRGPIYIHAGRKLLPAQLYACGATLKASGSIRELPEFESLPRGVLIAVVDIVDCGRFDDDPWAIRATGMWHFRLANVRLLPEPIPKRGQQGLWPV